VRRVLGGDRYQEGVPEGANWRGYQERCGWGYWRNGGVPGKVAGSMRDRVLRGAPGQKLGFPRRRF